MAIMPTALSTPPAAMEGIGVGPTISNAGGEVQPVLHQELEAGGLAEEGGVRIRFVGGRSTENLEVETLPKVHKKTIDGSKATQRQQEEVGGRDYISRLIRSWTVGREEAGKLDDMIKCKTFWFGAPWLRIVKLTA